MSYACQRGLCGKEEHSELCKLMSRNDLKIVTFGLTERSAKVRCLDFINPKNVLANFDNNESKWGRGIWGVETFPPSVLREFIEKQAVGYVIIMSDAVFEIGSQLDSLGVGKYYSSSRLRQLRRELRNEIHRNGKNDLLNSDGVLAEVMKSIHEPILRCGQLESRLVFEMDALSHCCNAPDSRDGHAYICDFNGGNFPLEKYRQTFRDYVLQNISRTGGCAGCQLLKLGPPDLYSKHISLISVNIGTDCQLRCKYCVPVKQRLTGKPYSVIPALKDLFYYGLIEKETVIGWSGGEATLYPYFEEGAILAASKNTKQIIYTNAVEYSEFVASLLASGKKTVSLNISVDSGNQQTYKIVKGVDCYDIAWENIKKYISYGDVSVKYILLEDNTDEQNLFGFIQQCVWAGASTVVVSVEFVELYWRTLRDRELHEKYMNAARYLCELAVKNGLTVELCMFNDEDAHELTRIIK
jgi:sulfatase maturation enzyme AslB (radical SAM superfamily)